MAFADALKTATAQITTAYNADVAGLKADIATLLLRGEP